MAQTLVDMGGLPPSMQDAGPNARTPSDGGAGPRLADTRVQRALWVLWPAFLVAAVAEFGFFALVDPQDLRLFGMPIEADRMTVYAAGFFAFWVMCSVAAGLSVYLQRSPWEVNRCTILPEDRPDGCPKKPDAAGCGNC